MATGRLLDVSRHEPRSVVAGTAVRIDVEPKFRGQQGKGGRTHLVSPAVAAATAVRGTLSSPADLSR